MYHLFTFLHRRHQLAVVYLANFLLSFHYFLVIYIQSSFLAEYISERAIGILYATSSVVNLILLFNASKILRKIGTYRLVLFTTAAEIIAIGTLVISSTPLFILSASLLHLSLIPLIAFSLDIFVEKYSKEENRTGRIRSIFLTLANTALVISPTIVSFLTRQGGFRGVYLLSFFFLIPSFFVIFWGLKKFRDVRPVVVHLKDRAARFFANENLRDVFFAALTLQVFYSWMIIYLPLYLFNEIGFAWTSLGVMFTIMLLPFVLFEIPLGIMADQKLGEKEILVLGFCVMAAATSLISSVTVADFMLWTVILFFTRTGASFVEIATETYFFKQVDARDSDAIGIFRLTRPLSFLIGPLIAIVALSFTSYRFIFLVLSAIVLLGLYPALRLKDTR